MLSTRDYRTLTKEEESELLMANEYLATCKEKNTIAVSAEELLKYHSLKPTAAYHYESLFPNNHLSPDDLDDKEKLSKIESEFIKLLENDISERNILNFINKNSYYNLIASLFQSGYTFGHHDAYLFKEFEFPSTYKADYLLVGKNSHGYHFLFIELENPYGSITKSNGNFGTTIRKGIEQVKDWDKWIEGNYHSMNLIFRKYKNERIELPTEFNTLDKSRINYIVIAGRRSDFTEKTYEEKRKLARNENIQIMHYDNLVDSFRKLQSTYNY